MGVFGYKVFTSNLVTPRRLHNVSFASVWSLDSKSGIVWLILEYFKTFPLFLT